MPLTVPSTIFPTEERFVNVIREATPGTIPSSSGTTFPMVNLEPDDKPLWLLDESLRGGMGDIYDFLQGPLYAEVTIPETPVYVDMMGHPLYNTLGDYTQSAPAAAPNTTTTAPAVSGATSLTVTSGTSFTVGMWIQVYAAGSTGPAEIVGPVRGLYHDHTRPDHPHPVPPRVRGYGYQHDCRGRDLLPRLLPADLRVPR